MSETNAVQPSGLGCLSTTTGLAADEEGEEEGAEAGAGIKDPMAELKRLEKASNCGAAKVAEAKSEKRMAV